MKKVILFSLMAMFLTSCGKFSDGTSIWAEGLFIIPWITGLAAVWFGYKAYKAHNSGSWKIGPNGEQTRIDAGKVPYTKIGWTWFSLGLLVATIVIIWKVNGDK